MMRSDSAIREEMFVPPEFTRHPTMYEKTLNCRNATIGFCYLLFCVPCFFCRLK